MPKKPSKHLTFPRSVFPNRPARPNYKGLGEFPAMWLKMPPGHLQGLRERAAYETQHWRLEHDGRGHSVSPADIIRRLIAQFFQDTSPLPDDPAGNTIRRQTERS